MHFVDYDLEVTEGAFGHPKEPKVSLIDNVPDAEIGHK